MDAASWDRLKALFDQASVLAEPDRDRLLARVEAEDAAIGAELRALLDSDSRLSGRVGHAMRAVARDAAEPSRTGQRIGPWRLREELGHGGMGAVYLAERDDGEFTQQVALKLVRPGMANEQILRRFHAERQFLARLHHPNIARLVDGGRTDDGRPWFAMERVQGEPIDRHCDRLQLTIDERLALFDQVCDAVAYAHANLVVHRDLKPDNIFVTADGRVRLLDFGIAKMVADDEDDATRTQTGLRIMTPGFASPEQVRGEPVGTPTDVYSLGVVLYVLLSGVRPYRVEGRSLGELERVICETEPERPSTGLTRASSKDAGAAAAIGAARRTDVRRLRRRLSGDLDVICLEALHKEPGRRYASVHALRDDLRRHRAGRPVLARPDRLRYRARKFVARNRLATASAAGGLLLAAGLTGFYLFDLARQRDVARVEAAKASEAAAFLRELFIVSDPSESRGQSVTARELLDAGAARIATELQGQPDVQATMMRVIGEVYQSLGLALEAKPLLEGALQRHRALHGDLHAETATSALAVGLVQQDLGDLEASGPLLREAVATREVLFGTPHEAVSEAMRHLAFWLETHGDYQESEQMLRAAIAQDRLLFPPGHERLANGLVRLGGILRRTRRYDEAEPLLREGLAAQRKLYGDMHPRVASTVRNLASLRRDQGDYVEAEALYLEALALRRALFGDVNRDVANTLNSYALMLGEKGDLEGAIRVYRELIAIDRKIYKDRPHPTLAATYNNLANTYREAGQPAEAIPIFRRAIAMQDEVLQEGHPSRAHPLIGIGRAYMALGRTTEADRAFRDALAIRRAALPAGHVYILSALDYLVKLHEASGTEAEAARFREELAAERAKTQ